MPQFNTCFNFWIKLVKHRKLFSSSDQWSPGAGFFPIGTQKFLKKGKRIFVQKVICFLRLKCMIKSCKNCVQRLTNLNLTFNTKYEFIDSQSLYYNFVYRKTGFECFYLRFIICKLRYFLKFDTTTTRIQIFNLYLLTMTYQIRC